MKQVFGPESRVKVRCFWSLVLLCLCGLVVAQVSLYSFFFCASFNSLNYDLILKRLQWVKSDGCLYTESWILILCFATLFSRKVRRNLASVYVLWYVDGGNCLTLLYNTIVYNYNWWFPFHYNVRWIQNAMTCVYYLYFMDELR